MAHNISRAGFGSFSFRVKNQMHVQFMRSRLSEILDEPIIELVENYGLRIRPQTVRRLIEEHQDEIRDVAPHFGVEVITS